MALFTIQHPMAFTFGILGNIVSFMVLLAPLPTFYRVYKKKSTEGFQSVPYVVALFSAMLWIYYAFLKTEAYLLITINTISCVIETMYIAVYIAYAPKSARIYTARLLLILNIGVFSSILLCTLFLAHGQERVRILGWVCMSFSVSVFAAPLSILRLVIKTKSVEFMPFSLSFFLTLSAVMWFFYGLLIRDFYIASLGCSCTAGVPNKDHPVLPNVLGFVFGILQMVLYMIFRGSKKVIVEEKLPEHMNNVVKLSAVVFTPDHQVVLPVVELQLSCKEVADQQVQEDAANGNLKTNEVQVCECQV